MVPRETENNAYAKFWRDKEYYGVFESGLSNEVLVSPIPPLPPKTWIDEEGDHSRNISTT